MYLHESHAATGTQITVTLDRQARLDLIHELTADRGDLRLIVEIEPTKRDTANGYVKVKTGKRWGRPFMSENIGAEELYH